MAVDEEAMTSRGGQKQGGWKTFPFIIGTKLAVGVAAYGLSANLTVYLIEQFNIPSVDATQINSIVNGCSALAPVVGAIVSDSGPGCYNVICGASVASFLVILSVSLTTEILLANRTGDYRGTLLFMLISALSSLRPPPCSPELCQAPTIRQLAIFYTATTLILAGLGGTRFISATFGAVQLDTVGEQASFFNWYVVTLYITVLFGLTVIIYVQVDMGWIWGFSLSAALSALGLILFLLGSRYYRHPKPQKNPLSMLLRAVARNVRRRKMGESSDYNRLDDDEVQILCPSSSDPTIEHTEGEEIRGDDLGFLIKLIPLISTGILINISISILTSLTILQALVMDRELGLKFLIPASSMPVFLAIATIFSVPILERVIFPVWRGLAHCQPKPLHRIGIGYFVTVLSAVVAAVIESRRLDALSQSAEPMSVLWLVPGLVLVGLGEALHFPGHFAFYYQELPDSLKNSATGVIALVSAIGFFASTAVVALVRRMTPWLQDDTNRSRLDNVYWMLTVVGSLNLVYFLICAKLYKREDRRNMIMIHDH